MSGYTARSVAGQIELVLNKLARELESPDVPRSQTIGKLHRAADAISEVCFDMLRNEKDCSIPEELQRIVVILYHVFGDL